jgi:hypothetical protein
MKSLIIVTILSLTLLSCKTSKNAGCDAYSSLYEKTKPIYTQSMADRFQSEDVKFMKENWTKEQIEEFGNTYIYKTVIFKGDTLR